MITEAEINAVVAKLAAARAALPDVLDLPRTMTQRQVNDHEQRLAAFHAVGLGITSTLGLMRKPNIRLATYRPDCERERAAWTAIEKQIVEAGDWREVPDARERDKEWGRQQSLHQSLNAIKEGVVYSNDTPMLPAPLRALLTETCSACGHETLHWAGSLPWLEKTIAEDEKTIARLQLELESLLGQAEVLLATEQPTTVSG
jgi:hypothetical protein